MLRSFIQHTRGLKVIGRRTAPFSVATAAAAVVSSTSCQKAIPSEVVLYQYAPCPYCNKVRAALDFYQIPYQVVEVNPLTKKEIEFTDYKKVPVATINGVEVRDSTEIISALQAEFVPMYVVSIKSQLQYSTVFAVVWLYYYD